MRFSLELSLSNSKHYAQHQAQMPQCFWKHMVPCSCSTQEFSVSLQLDYQKLQFVKDLHDEKWILEDD
ncbi:hypothetical protein EUGRSUZ_K03538 [Eucalyptus grandis]|uniref:Uncharacterized protein n=2 Tax=Eucalyptus grandis TaxID=71139 RepID=A0ACC3J042_EUCGR|nr:hypothetical protein EUGRSUZ_K03538 [Eucalyptus grandis]